MTVQIFGQAVARGVAIGRAVLIATGRVDVAHYFISADQADGEIERLRAARDAVAAELSALQHDLPADAPHELSALLDVHLMLLHDEALVGAAAQWVRERHYNAEWALSQPWPVRTVPRRPASQRRSRPTSAARSRWCWWPATLRLQTCCSSDAACSRGS